MTEERDRAPAAIERGAVVSGGLALVLGALAFLGVFGYLAGASPPESLD